MNEVVKSRIEQIIRGEVPEGYKKTKVGIVPEEWEIHSLSRHLTQSCIPGTNGSVARKLTVKLWNKGVYAKREIHEGSESTTYYKRKSGQLIYSKLDFLNCAFGIIPEELDGFESTQDLPCFDIHGVNKYFLLSYITRRSFYTHFGMIADGGRKARRVGPEDMLSFPLLYPSLAEQKKIAEILAAQDKVIALKEKLLEEKKKQKKYLMQQLLTGKKRLPGFSGEWKSNTIGSFLSIKDIRQCPSAEYPLMAFVANIGITSKGERYDRSHLIKDDNKDYKITEYNDFIYSSNNLDVGSIGLNLHGNAVISVVYEIFDVKNTAIPIIISCVIQLAQNMNKILKYRQGAIYGQYTIHAEDFLKVIIRMPPLREQSAIAEVLSNADKEISIIQKSIGQEKQEKSPDATFVDGNCEGMSMKCPYCNTSVHLNYQCDIYEEQDQNHFETGKGISIDHAYCPECNKLIVRLQHGTIGYNGSYEENNIDLFEPDLDVIIYPKFPSGYALDKSIPQRYADLFKESEQVNAISPRASATISRYLLQMLLQEELHIKERNLEPAISKLESESNVPSSLIQMLQIFRRIANFGAHPKKSTNGAEILDIEKGESEVMLELLLELLDYLFVKPAKQREFLKEIKDKYGIESEVK